MRRSWTDSRGTVSLLVLSLVTVLAISLAGYITVSGRSMRLANRVFLNGLASNLAESGVEQALWTLNNANWTSWTAVGGGALAASDTVAVRTITFAATKYGSSGVVGAINVRIHGRRAKQWVHWDTHTTGDMVWYLGRWWQCVSNHGPVTVTTFPSTTANWIPAPSAWSAAVTYSAGTSAHTADIVISGGTAYRCTAANTNSPPPGTGWTSLGTPAVWSPTANYAPNAVVVYQGTVYRSRATNSGFVPTDTTYWVGAPAIHAEGVVTPPGATLAGSGGDVRVQVRAELAPVPLFPNALGGRSAVTGSSSSTGVVSSFIPNAATTWSSTTTYVGGDLVIRNGIYYRCILGHTNFQPPNTTYWTPGSASTPLQGHAAVVAGAAVTLPAATSVWGHVASPSPSFGTSTVVKSATSSASPNQDPSRITSNAFVPQPAISSVSGVSVTAIPGGWSSTVLADGTTTTLGFAGETTPRVYNITGTRDGSGTQSGVYLWDSADQIVVNGPVILNVSGPFVLNAGTITIASTGSLEVYFTGQFYIGNSSTSGGGIINNTNINDDSSRGPDPMRVIFVSANTTNTTGTHYLWQARPFHALIYMPNALIHSWNSGYSPPRYGAQNGRTVYFEHTVNFAYDLRLRTAGRLARFVEAPFYVSAWRELTDPAEKVTF